MTDITHIDQATGTKIILPAFCLSDGLAQKHEAKIAAVIHKHEGRRGRLPPSMQGRPGPVRRDADTPMMVWRQGIMELLSDGCGWRLYDICTALGAGRDEIDEALREMRQIGLVDAVINGRWSYWARHDEMACENKRLDGILLSNMRRGEKHLTSQLAPFTGRNVNACANRLGVMYRKGIVDRVLVGKTSQWFLV